MDREEQMTVMVSNLFKKDDKFNRLMARVIVDLSNQTGWGDSEILDFIENGHKDEVFQIERDFRWNEFKMRMLKKLKPSQSKS
jgi:hypothetical protein